MSQELEGVLRLVEDSSKGFVVDHVVHPALRPAFEVLASMFWRQWRPAVSEFRLNLEEAIRKRTAENAQYIQRLNASIGSEEATALASKLVAAAASASTEDRMRFLAAAAAGLLTPDLSVEMRSRVSRAVEQLEASDVIALREVAKALQGPGRVQQVPGEPQNRVSLIQAGCIEEGGQQGLRNRFVLTPLGGAVLMALRDWAGQSATPAV